MWFWLSLSQCIIAIIFASCCFLEERGKCYFSHTKIWTARTVFLNNFSGRFILLFWTGSWQRFPKMNSESFYHLISSSPVYDPELTLSTEDAEADLLLFFFLPLPTLDWPDPEASETLVPSITFAPSVVMAAMLSSVPFELKWFRITTMTMTMMIQNIRL